MNANDGAVDHLDIAFMGLNNRVHEAIPDPCLSPSVEAIVDRGQWALSLGEIRLGNARAQPPEDADEHTQIIDARHCRATCWDEAAGSHSIRNRSVLNEPCENSLSGV